MRLPVDKMLEAELKPTRLQTTIDGFDVTIDAGGWWRVDYVTGKGFTVEIHCAYSVPEGKRSYEAAKKSVYAVIAKAQEIRAALDHGRW